MKKSLNKVPKFINKTEEAAYWDTHSVADYWNEWKDIDLAVTMQQPKEETLVVRLQKDVKQKLTELAKKKGISASSLARMWLVEKMCHDSV